MRVFISWSGNDSKKAATLMRNWLPNVIQEVQPWISTHEIRNGERWQVRLAESLADTEFGLLMVTKTNFNEPWIVFEAGALSKLPNSKVVPLLCCMDPWDIANTPLSQFQAVKVSKEGIQEVITDIAKQSSKPLPERQVMAAFEKWWPDFEKDYNCIQFETEGSDEKEDDPARYTAMENVLQDIMKTLRRIEQMVNFATTSAGVPASLGLAPPIRFSDAILSQIAKSLTFDELSNLAASVDINRALKLAASLPGRKYGKGMIKPEEGERDRGNKDASEEPDEKARGDD